MIDINIQVTPDEIMAEVRRHQQLRERAALTLKPGDYQFANQILVYRPQIDFPGDIDVAQPLCISGNPRNTQSGLIFPLPENLVILGRDVRALNTRGVGIELGQDAIVATLFKRLMDPKIVQSLDQAFASARPEYLFRERILNAIVPQLVPA